MADSLVSRFGCYTIIWDTTPAGFADEYQRGLSLAIGPGRVAPNGHAIGAHLPDQSIRSGQVTSVLLRIGSNRPW